MFTLEKASNLLEANMFHKISEQDLLDYFDAPDLSSLRDFRQSSLPYMTVFQFILLASANRDMYPAVYNTLLEAQRQQILPPNDYVTVEPIMGAWKEEVASSVKVQLPDGKTLLLNAELYEYDACGIRVEII